MGFEVETMKFEGPLDLMLHLIQEQKLDIFDLDMAVLADQYLSYLHKMESLQLEIESEYLVELSTLVEYKSKKLLPKKKDEEDEELRDIMNAACEKLKQWTEEEFRAFDFSPYPFEEQSGDMSR